MTVKKRQKDEIVDLLLKILLPLWAIAVLSMRTWETVLYPLASALGCYLISFALDRRHKRKSSRLLKRPLLHGLLAGLILSQGDIIPVLVTVPVIAYLTEKSKKQPVTVMPGLYGVIAASLLLGAPATWWGVTPGPWAWAVYLLCIPLLWRLEKIRISAFFLGGYFLFFLLLKGFSFALSQTLEGVVIFFALLLLPFSQTTVKSKKSKLHQEVWSLIVFAWFVVLYVLRFTWTDILLTALAAAQIHTVQWKKWRGITFWRFSALF